MTHMLRRGGLLKKPAKAGVEQAKPFEEYEFGWFAWIVDREGTKIELWEPAPK